MRICDLKKSIETFKLHIVRFAAHFIIELPCRTKMKKNLKIEMKIPIHLNNMRPFPCAKKKRNFWRMFKPGYVRFHLNQICYRCTALSVMSVISFNYESALQKWWNWIAASMSSLCFSLCTQLEASFLFY